MLKLLLPDAVRARCARQFAREQLGWLSAAEDVGVGIRGGIRGDISGGINDDIDAGTSDGTRLGTRWPVVIPLGMPNERDAAAQPELVRAWAAAWSAWQAGGQPGRLVWESRQWPRLGAQRLPLALELATAADVADAAGQGTRWRRAGVRHQALCSACGALAGRPVTQRLLDAAADYGDDDFARLVALLAWLERNPASGLQLRQLPIAGLDTKWIEQRRGLVIDLLLSRRGSLSAASATSGGPNEPTGRDLHTLLGLTKAPPRVRLRLLDETLRRQVGGLLDIEAPLAELAALPIAPRRVLVVENLESGLALPSLPGTVALMKLGHAVNLLRQLPWLQAARIVVWGDIDTHGYAILDRVRAALPQTESMLMDRDTLLGHRPLWVEEPQPYVGPALERLNEAERMVYAGLVDGMWGPRVRLEQERLPWPLVERALAAL